MDFPQGISFFYRITNIAMILHRFSFRNFCHLRLVQTGVAMDTAVGKIAVHTVDLCQVLGTADRADIHVEFLVAAVIAVSQGQVDALVVAELHCTLDQGLDRTFVVADSLWGQ